MTAIDATGMRALEDLAQAYTRPAGRSCSVVRANSPPR